MHSISVINITRIMLGVGPGQIALKLPINWRFSIQALTWFSAFRSPVAVASEEPTAESMSVDEMDAGGRPLEAEPPLSSLRGGGMSFWMFIVVRPFLGCVFSLLSLLDYTYWITLYADRGAQILGVGGY